MLKKQWKKVLSLFLVLAMAVCLFPSALAAEIEPEQDEDGYYLITSADEWDWVCHKLTAEANQNYDMNIKLQTDLTLYEDQVGLCDDWWYPYEGTFDGGGHTIYFYGSTGLFKYVGDCTIRNLMIYASIDNREEDSCIGVFANEVIGYATFERCVSSFRITSGRVAGGIIGCVNGKVNPQCIVNLIECGNEGNLSVLEVTELGSAGGLIGSVNCAQVIIRSCYSKSNIINYSEAACAGGFVGKIAAFDSAPYDSCTIDAVDCYNYGEIPKIGENVGALFGYSTSAKNQISFQNTYLLCGINKWHADEIGGYLYNGSSEGDINIDSCYWPIDIYFPIDSGFSIQSSEMQTQSFLDRLNANSEGSNVWIADPNGYNNGFPVLAWEYAEVPEEEPEEEPSGNPALDSDGFYILENNDDLEWFTNEVNSGNSGISAKLAADVQTSTSIATDNTAPYTGTFDGQGHTITISLTSAALFQYVGSATIRNLTLEGTASGSTYMASLASQVVGGATFERCINRAAVRGDTYSGGMIGYIYANGSTITMTECGNEGSVVGTSTSNYACTGGIVGYMIGGTITLQSCYNSGNVTATAHARSGAGGILGRTSGTIKMYDCYNSGNVTHLANSTYPITGGLSGYNIGSLTVRNCYTSGTIVKSATDTGGAVRGSGGNGSNMFSYCYWLEGSCAVEGTVGTKTSLDEMLSADFVSLLNETSKVGDSVWAMDMDDMNGGFPVLAWQLPEKDPAETLEPVITISQADGTPVAEVTAPAGGWILGENTFTVTGGNACVVAVTYDGGESYTTLAAVSNNDGSYGFTADVTAEAEIMIVLKGDVNADGALTSADAAQVQAAVQQQVTLEPSQKLAADVDSDGTLRSADAAQIQAAVQRALTLEW